MRHGAQQPPFPVIGVVLDVVKIEYFFRGDAQAGAHVKPRVHGAGFDDLGQGRLQRTGVGMALARGGEARVGR